MIAEIYQVIYLFIIPGILLGMGICFFFLSIPKREGLRNYRIARHVMGYAYLFYALGIFMEHYGCSENANTPLSQLITLVISCSQAFLFTYTLITLVNIRFTNKRRVIKEALSIATLSVAMFAMYAYLPKPWFELAIYLFAAFYIFLLMRYVVLFRKQYRDYVARMDEFFSDEETRRLHWVSVSFYASLVIGIMALFYAMFPISWVSLSFMTVVVVFYAMFGVRFLNYAFVFQTFETAIEQQEGEPEAPKETFSSETDHALMQRIDTLMTEQCLYKKNDLTIEEIASILGEKNRSVSTAINRCRQTNFKTYINEYRVAEAVRLLSEDKESRLTVDAIAYDAGFSDRSNFYRVFKKHKGISPTEFRTA